MSASNRNNVKLCISELDSSEKLQDTHIFYIFFHKLQYHKPSPAFSEPSPELCPSPSSVFPEPSPEPSPDSDCKAPDSTAALVLACAWVATASLDFGGGSVEMKWPSRLPPSRPRGPVAARAQISQLSRHQAYGHDGG